jgi:hypothetical protein
MDSLQTKLTNAKSERSRYEYGTYQYSIWDREVKRLLKEIDNAKENKPLL